MNWTWKRSVEKWFQKCYWLNKKNFRKEICSDLLQCTQNGPGLLKSEITCDETWIFMYDPETKWQLMLWKSPNSQRTKKATWVIQSSRPCWLFSWISRVLWQSGFPLARLSINTIIPIYQLNFMKKWEGNGQYFGEIGGFSIRTMHHPVMLRL